MHIRKNLTLLSWAVAGGVWLPAAAQTAVSPGESVIERIMSTSNGSVEIDIPVDILELMMREDVKTQTGQPNLRPGINKLSGYRIQVFSDGSNQRGLEAKARSRGNAVASRFPKYRGQVYTYSSSPNWYTRVGNFRTQQEAAAALAELKRAFPSIAGEMRIVKSQIVIIK